MELMQPGHQINNLLTAQANVPRPSDSAAQQRHAPDAATRPEIGGILHCDFVPDLTSIQ
jgi:hypothetical protein